MIMESKKGPVSSSQILSLAKDLRRPSDQRDRVCCALGMRLSELDSESQGFRGEDD